MASFIPRPPVGTNSDGMAIKLGQRRKGFSTEYTILVTLVIYSNL